LLASGRIRTGVVVRRVLSFWKLASHLSDHTYGVLLFYSSVMGLAIFEKFLMNRR
jgi:hypothetical protein